MSLVRKFSLDTVALGRKFLSEQMRLFGWRDRQNVCPLCGRNHPHSASNDCDYQPCIHCKRDHVYESEEAAKRGCSNYETKELF